MYHLYFSPPSSPNLSASPTSSQSSRTSFPSPSAEKHILTKLLFQQTQLILNILKIILALFLLVILPDEHTEKKLKTLEIWCGYLGILAFFEMALNIHTIIQQRQELSRETSLDLSALFPNSNSRNTNINNGSLLSLQRLLQFISKITHSKNELLNLLSHIIHFALFVYGNALMKNTQDYKDTTLYQIAFIYLLMGYLVFCIPLICCLILVLYLPVVLIGYLIFHRNIIEMLSERSNNKMTQSIQEAKLEQLNAIDETTFQQSFLLQEECIVCMKLYANGDSVLALPCSKHHHFHRACIHKWLRINSQCPICRQDINKVILELKESNISQASTMQEIV